MKDIAERIAVRILAGEFTNFWNSKGGGVMSETKKYRNYLIESGGFIIEICDYQKTENYNRTGELYYCLNNIKTVDGNGLTDLPDGNNPIIVEAIKERILIIQENKRKKIKIEEEEKENKNKALLKAL